jgi:hypothetical protein
MAYRAIDTTVAEIVDTDAALSAGVARRVTENAEHTAASRLKRCGLVWHGGVTDEATAADVTGANMVGAQGVVSRNNSGVDVTGADVLTSGCWVSTPTQRPMLAAWYWPISANAARIRLVLCSEAQASGVHVVAHVWDGQRWYPYPPSLSQYVGSTVASYESPDTLAPSPEVIAGSNYARITSDATADGLRWDALTVDMPGRARFDGSYQRPGDVPLGVIALSILSAKPTANDGVTLIANSVAVDDGGRAIMYHMQPANIPANPNKIGTYHGHLVTPTRTGGFRWRHVPCVLPRDSQGPHDVTWWVWPPVTAADVLDSSSPAVKVFPAGRVRMMSIGVSELGE